MDKWYKLLAGISAVVLVFSLFVESVVANNKALSLISLGTFLFAVTEWSQYKQKSAVDGFNLWNWTHKESGVFPLIVKMGAIVLILLGIINLF